MGGAFAAPPEVETVRTCTEIAWRRLFDRFWSPKTGLLYEHLPDERAGAIERFLPTPDEIARNEPIATGWNTGMEDGVLNGLPCRSPVSPESFQNAYACVRELGEAVIVPLLSPDVVLDATYLARYRALLAKMDFSTHMSPGLVYPVLAEAMLREQSEILRAAGLWGTVARTPSGPEDPSWKLRADDYRQINEAFRKTKVKMR